MEVPKMTPEELRCEIDKYLLKQNVSTKTKVAFRLLAIWSYNEGLKARKSVQATEKL